MRIQHNIMAMNSYRNLGINNNAISKNLEKLSSGYAINRAGDDAAGLAISEKMRAQITGLDVAQDNAQAGINLVQTAEGALTEVHDMLNRMYELAEQSANGTMAQEDRDQIQKEVDALIDEIDRIADGTNFNGINLLDGSQAGGDLKAVAELVSGGNDQTVTAATTQKQTITLGAVGNSNATTLSVVYKDSNGKAQTLELDIDPTAATASAVADAVATALADKFAGFTVATSTGGAITITANESGAQEFEILSLSVAGEAKAATIAMTTEGKDAYFAVNLSTVNQDANHTFEIDGKKFQIVEKGGDVFEGHIALELDTVATAALTEGQVATIVEQLKKNGVNASVDAADADGLTIAFAQSDGESTGGLTLQIGDTSDSFNQLTVGIGDCHAEAIGVGDLKVDTIETAGAALDTIKRAIQDISDVRGGLGAAQNRLEHTINNLAVTEENITEAESTVRDTDVAEEMMAYTKNNILIQSAQAMLAQANQVPQGVLQLLG